VGCGGDARHHNLQAPLEREGPAGLGRAGRRCWGRRGPAAAPSQLGGAHGTV